MKSKRLFQILVSLTLLFSPLGSEQSVSARSSSMGLEIVQTQSSVYVTVNPSSVNIHETAIATVGLNNVPSEGYTSVELTCSYDTSLLEASNIMVANLFGTDPAVAIHGPQAGGFIVAIAGSRGNKATGDGAIITFNVKGLQVGQTALNCEARVSRADNQLTNIYSVPGSITIQGDPLTPTLVPALCDKADFAADVNVPPGTVMSPGATFTKTWRLANVGSCTWTPSYQLVFLHGEQMGAYSPVSFSTYVTPGQMVDISLTMTAPSMPGSYRGYWMFRNANGQLFGAGPDGNQPWFVDIIVSGATGTATSTATPSATPQGPNNSPTPSITPGGPTATPDPGILYDFASNACYGVWYSGAGQLPCPGVDGNPNGFVLKLEHPRLETGAVDARPGLLTFPQNVQNGYIQGFYPPFLVQNGDRFRSTIGCEGGATNCYVAFRIDYQIGSESIRTLWGPFLERYEGRPFNVDLDLSSLAGQNVKFILTVQSAGVATGDRALWVGPAIYRSGAVPVPTFSSTPTTSATPTAQQDEWERYISTKYWFEFYFPEEGYFASNSTTGNYDRIILPFTPGTHLNAKYLDVTIVEDFDTCRSPLAATSAVDSVGMAFVNGITFLQESGHNQAAGNLIRWFAFSTYRDNACVSLDLILRATDPDLMSTPLPPFDVSAEAAVLQQVVGTFAWLTPPTATPDESPISTATHTATPSGSLTPTPTLSPTMGTITGQVLAGKPVIVDLYAAGNWPVASVLANADGTFSLTAPSGTYTLNAHAFGFLSARGPVTVTGGSTSTKPAITLLAGDIDGDFTINQFDALTIGMNYNASFPEAADLNNDGIINVLDLELLANNYRKIGPVIWE